MTIEQAISKAVEGGWHNRNYQAMSDGEVKNRQIVENNLHESLLDPFFWQSLGKAMGWEEDKWMAHEGLIDGPTYYWHNLIDHLADGKSIEEYFEKL